MQLQDVNNKLSELRRDYPVFSYDGFHLEDCGAGLRLRFEYSVSGKLSFKSDVLFESAPNSWRSIPGPVIENLVFHLGIIESFSYWKATCAPRIVINAGSLDDSQIEWWIDLLLHGMREFFYVNSIDFTIKNFVNISTASRATGFNKYDGTLQPRSLLPIGGGRDSAFTARAFQNAGKPFGCMLLNPIAGAARIASAVGCDQPIVIRRSIDPRLLELNKNGFLNGHTPFSAYLAFLGAMCLPVYDYQHIVIANERSSDEENTTFLGEKINHQYSKSFAFEQKFDEYLKKYLVSNGSYFSFVRPLYELQIGRAFSQHVDLFSAFKSCNRNHKDDSWCGNCPKCISVFITFYPFVSYSDVIKTFGSDYFESESTIPILRQLTGLDKHKPFECVTTLKEAIASIHLCVKRCEESGRPLPISLRYAQDNILPNRDEAELIALSILHHDDDHHQIPEEFERVLRAEIKI